MLSPFNHTIQSQYTITLKVQLNSGKDSPHAVAKPNIAAFRAGVTAQDDSVSVFQERPLRAIRQLDGVLPVRLLEQTTLGLGVRAGDGAATEQITGVHVAAGDSVVGEHLREREQKVLSVGARDRRRLAAVVGDLNLERDVVDVLGLLLAQVGQQRVAVLGLQARGAERLQSVHEDDPGGDCRGEVLGVEGAQGDVFPGLDIARGPVVHEHQAEDVVFGFVDRDGSAEVVGSADEGGELELDVETLAGGEGWGFRVGGWVGENLAVGTVDGGAGCDDRRRTAVVSHGQVLVVGLQGVVRSTEENTDVVGVIETGVEIRVVANLHGNVVGDLRQGQECLLLQSGIFLESLREWGVCTEHVLDVFTDLTVHGATKSSECVQRRLAEHVEMRLDDRQLRETSSSGEGAQVQGIVANRNRCDTRGDIGRRDDSKGDICQRKGRVFGDLKPRSHDCDREFERQHKGQHEE